jgi:hypothetical protein
LAGFGAVRFLKSSSAAASSQEAVWSDVSRDTPQPHESASNATFQS